MSAAAARRRKQLQKKSAATNNIDEAPCLKALWSNDDALDEETAYEALQLAQSQVRKKANAGDFSAACELAYKASLALLKKHRVSVASQLLNVLVDVLIETHTEVTQEWIDKLLELDKEHKKAIEAVKDKLPGPEVLRLQRLEWSWLKSCVTSWSAVLGKVRYGDPQLCEALAQHCWDLSKLENPHDDYNNTIPMKHQNEDEADDLVLELQCEAVQYMVLAEKPDTVADWLQSLPKPSKASQAAGHTVPPALRDAIFTRAVIFFVMLENLRDGNVLVQRYMKIEERSVEELQKSYTAKDDGVAPSHLMFACMLLRVCEKDTRTGPLFSWLMRSFKRELDGLYKAQAVASWTSKIGQVYFNITPPPSMLNMIENMMGMMGGGAGGGGGNPMLNPAMMQAAMAQLQQGNGMM